MKARRKAREIALQALYAAEMEGPEVREMIGNLCAENVEAEVSQYALNLAMKVKASQTRLDGLISEQAANWKLDRVAVIDRNILRMALAEMLYIDDVPPKVSIDEAIELAKKFSTEKSGRFVNGILDPIAKNKIQKL